MLKIKSIKLAVVFVSVLMLSFGISSVSHADKKQEAKKQLTSSSTAGRVVYAEKITKKSYAKKTGKPRKAEPGAIIPACSRLIMKIRRRIA